MSESFFPDVTEQLPVLPGMNLYAPIHHMMLSFDTLVLALKSDFPTYGPQGSFASSDCVQIPFTLYWKNYAAWEAAHADPEGSPVLSLLFQPNSERKYGSFDWRRMRGLNTYYINSIAGPFVSYFEKHIEFIRGLARYDIKRLPWPWDFARVVRNAIVHGSISIQDKKFTPVRWCNLTYGPDDHGRDILGADLNIADLVFLLIHMEGVLWSLSDPATRVP